jgi:hypothetical protein
MTTYYPDFDIEFIDSKLDTAWNNLSPGFDKPGAV